MLAALATAQPLSSATVTLGDRVRDKNRPSAQSLFDGYLQPQALSIFFVPCGQLFVINVWLFTRPAWSLPARLKVCLDEQNFSVTKTGAG
jgi:hypothetical protein